MTQFALQHASEIIDGPSYVVHANHLTDNFNAIISDFADRLSLITASAQTVAGAVTFSSAATFTSGFTSNGGVTLASTFSMQGASAHLLLASGTAAASVTDAGLYVSSAGSPPGIRYQGTKWQFTNDGSAFNDLSVGVVTAVNNRSSNTIWAAGDNGALFVYTSTFTQTITAAATLASKWACYVRNDGTGIITLDPNSSETIDGQTTIQVYPGEAFAVVCDGSNFKTIGRARMVLISSQSASSSTSIDFTTGFSDPEIKIYKPIITDLVPATNDTRLQIRVSEDSGSSWKSGASDYSTGIFDGSGAGQFNASATVIETGSSTATTMIQNGSGKSAFFEMTLANPAGTSLYKSIRGCGEWEDSNTGSVRAWEFSGRYKGTTNAINGLRFLMNSGNITSGLFKLYGVRG